MQQQAFPLMVEYTVEDLNPKGMTVKQTEMGIRRSQALGAMCVAVLDQTQDMYSASQTLPWMTGTVASSKIKDVFGDGWYRRRHIWEEWWPWIMEYWYSGGMERGEREAAENLPLEIRKRSNAKSGKSKPSQR